MGRGEGRGEEGRERERRKEEERKGVTPKGLVDSPVFQILKNTLVASDCTGEVKCISCNVQSPSQHPGIYHADG